MSSRAFIGHGRHRLIAPVAVLFVLLLAAAPAEASKPKRIVALTPFSANVVAKLGVRPVGIGEGAAGRRKLNRKLRGVPRLPLSHASNGPNLEQLVARDPDLVFSERTWRAGHGAVRDLGIRVKESDPYRVGQLRRKVVQIGKTLGKRSRAKKLGRAMARDVKQARKRIRKRPKTLVIMGVGSERFAFLPHSWGGNLFQAAGANLLTRGLVADGEDFLVSGGFANLSNEEILSRNPDVIVAVPHGTAEQLPQTAANLRNDPILAQTNAGENNRLYVINDVGVLQATTNVAHTIKKVRRKYLRNR